MPITVTGGGPGGAVGPGLPIIINADPSHAPSSVVQWRISLTTPSPDNFVFGSFAIFRGQNWQQNLYQTGLLPTESAPSTPIADDGTVRIIVTWEEPVGSVQDFVITTKTWDATTGLPGMIADLRAHQGTVTLSPTQSAQLQNASDNTDQMETNWNEYTAVTLPSLQDVLNGITTGVTAVFGTGVDAVQRTLGQIFSGKTIDQLVSESLTGGETCDEVHMLLGGATAWGIEVRITTIPGWYAFTGPGETYSQQVLAVLELRRGDGGLLRRGIHTRTDMIYPLPGVWDSPLTFDLPVVPPDYNLDLWWGEGVCGEVLLIHLP